MRHLAYLLLPLTLLSCSTSKSKFEKESVCSAKALRYLSNPRNREKHSTLDPRLVQRMAASTRSMQLCYEDFRNRTGQEVFSTCLVVGVDAAGELEFHNFGSQEAKLDDEFLRCADAVTKAVDYGHYGKNYLFIQSYQFYLSDNQ